MNTSKKLLHSEIEKKRRERMNACISHLKYIVPIIDPSENLQKLSILEKTIEYIMQVQNHRDQWVPPSPTLTHKDNVMAISNLIS